RHRLDLWMAPHQLLEAHPRGERRDQPLPGDEAADRVQPRVLLDRAEQHPERLADRRLAEVEQAGARLRRLDERRLVERRTDPARPELSEDAVREPEGARAVGAAVVGRCRARAAEEAL